MAQSTRGPSRTLPTGITRGPSRLPPGIRVSLALINLAENDRRLQVGGPTLENDRSVVVHLGLASPHAPTQSSTCGRVRCSIQKLQKLHHNQQNMVGQKEARGKSTQGRVLQTNTQAEHQHNRQGKNTAHPHTTATQKTLVGQNHPNANTRRERQE